PARLCAPSQISSGSSLRRSSRPGSTTPSAACGSTWPPVNASAAAVARARLLAPATTTSAAPFARASSSHSACPRTTVQPGCTTASFSAAISSRVSPRTSMWSSATFVRQTTRVRRTFVASWRPPSPASTTAASTPAAANSASAAAVRISNCVASAATGRTRATARSKSASAPPTRMRSLQPRTCGERYAPTWRPVSASSASVMRVVVDLPFVPTTWTHSYSSCGSPSLCSSERIRSVPKPPAGHGLSAATQSVAERVKLGPVLRELPTLALDHVGRGVRDELVVREHALRPRDFLREPRPLGGDVALPVAGRAHDRVEDAQRITREPDAHAAAAIDTRAGLGALDRAELVVVRHRLRPRSDDQPRLAPRQVRPDLLGDVRHHR